ncbi:MAG TPA: hemerythrin domain-containing protein [Terriglobia bacterium]|jgi:hemerythrin superfamily protein|nr:hemerythrin domain-containing protein [Terriglobia bacterium]
MDAIDLLRRDHRDLERLVAEFDEAKSDKELAELFVRIRAKLLAHAEADLRVFYPAIKSAAADEIKRSAKDYIEIAKILKELHFNDDRFDERFLVLKFMIRDHIDADESVDGVLDIARARLEPGELVQMAQKIVGVEQTVRGDKAA